jgi:hypothetical protein
VPAQSSQAQCVFDCLPMQWALPLQVSLRGQAAWFGRLDRQRAAIAADLALAWRRCTAAAAGDEV